MGAYKQKKPQSQQRLGANLFFAKKIQ